MLEKWKIKSCPLNKTPSSLTDPVGIANPLIAWGIYWKMKEDIYSHIFEQLLKREVGIWSIPGSTLYILRWEVFFKKLIGPTINITQLWDLRDLPTKFRSQMTVPKPNIIIYHLQKFPVSVLSQEKKKRDKILIVYDMIIISKPTKKNFIYERFQWGGHALDTRWDHKHCESVINKRANSQ